MCSTTGTRTYGVLTYKQPVTWLLRRPTPQDDVGPLKTVWSRPLPPSDPTQSNQSVTSSFSAVCLTFALGLVKKQPELSQRPMGLVVSATGGTPVEAWMSSKSATNCPEVPKDAGCQHKGNITSSLYNGMIYPLRQMAFKLAVWYQVGVTPIACGNTSL